MNETRYPAEFARNATEIVKHEYPYPYSFSGCDKSALGHEYFPVLFTHPSNADKTWAIKNLDPKISYFTREWGDNVDDWNAQNSNSRIARNWGEHAMLAQAWHYAAPSYAFTCYDGLYRLSRQHVGGCLWHSFDHQRGYHPDPFYGGIMDVFRQPKYSYYMFQAQRSPIKQNRPFQTGPMVFIAHEMSPFSPSDVTVYSNCDEVRLTYCQGGKVYHHKKTVQKEGMPSPIITFKDVYDFVETRNAVIRKKTSAAAYLLAEGIMNGKVVTVHKVTPARRPSKIMLALDDEGMGLKADGSDVVTVIALVTDKNGVVKRLNNHYIKFQIEGEGRLLGGADILANPAPVKWGTAPVLIQSTLNPGKIKITATMLFEGTQTPISGVLEFSSRSSNHAMIFSETEVKSISTNSNSLLVGTKSEKQLESENNDKK